ncbi:MAG: site-specific DNA-methyltransferase [Chitinophagales bacterium]|nr:site-specific DNA-methyltransferase [Chitinophagales bacterium]
MNDKLDLQSPDISAMNIDKIAALFPNCLTETAEGKRIDFDLLKQELSTEIVEGNKERYRLEWPGKREAIVTANLPTTNTLRPVREDSVDFDTTQNIYIEGDNLEVLKLLQESYLNKIKMIYIDPPYNTGKDFVYKDNFARSSEEELFESGQKDEYGQRLQANPETSGRYHSDWLSMMYPRLKLARNLLTEDGVIFISIDDNEVHNLRKICDEIFGEENFVGCLPTIMNLKGNNDEFGFSGTHEFTIVYAKSKISISDLNGIPLDKEDEKEYSSFDELGAYKQGATLMRTGEAGAREKRPKGYYPIYVSNDLKSISLKKNNENDYIVYPKTSNGKEMSWRRSPEFLNETLNEFIIKQTNNGITFYKKQRLLEDLKNGKKAKSLFYKPEYSSGNGTSILQKLFDGRLFDNPKPISLISDFISIGLNSNDIILDFFSGSATTAHAVMQLNADTSTGSVPGNRKYIMVQLPEATDEKSEAYKAGYKNICEIGKERIRRAAKQIRLNQDSQDKKDSQNLFSDKNQDNSDKNNPAHPTNQENHGPDFGFRVYRLDSSNMQEVYYKPQDYQQANLDLFADNVKPDRSAEDLVTQIMLDWGLELSLPIERKTIAGKEVFAVAGNSLYCCFDTEIDEAFAKEVAKDQALRIVFRDKGFKDDTAKENVKQLLKQLAPNTEMRVV